jgi:hypothetical protein
VAYSAFCTAMKAKVGRGYGMAEGSSTEPDFTPFTFPTLSMPGPALPSAPLMSLEELMSRNMGGVSLAWDEPSTQALIMEYGTKSFKNSVVAHPRISKILHHVTCPDIITGNIFNSDIIALKHPDIKAYNVGRDSNERILPCSDCIMLIVDGGLCRNDGYEYPLAKKVRERALEMESKTPIVLSKEDLINRAINPEAPWNGYTTEATLEAMGCLPIKHNCVAIIPTGQHMHHVSCDSLRWEGVYSPKITILLHSDVILYNASRKGKHDALKHCFACLPDSVIGVSPCPANKGSKRFLT